MKAFGFRPKLYTALKNYSKELFMADLMAGIIVGIVALPLAIAFGIASGVSPEKGIITAIIAGFIIKRYCRHHLHYADCRYFRVDVRRRESSGRLCRKMDDLFPTFRYRKLVEHDCKYCQHLHHCHYTAVLEEDSGVTYCHHRGDSGSLADESIWRH